jgi:hypothetical protein
MMGMKKSIVFTLIIASGCSGAAGNVAPPSSIDAGFRIHKGSGSSPLIYANYGQAVLIYNTSGDKVGSLGGFSRAGGLCSDAYGDVTVPDSGRQVVYVYQGGSLPVNVIDDHPYGPVSCAIDPTTGTLAVINGNNVAVYQPGTTSGSPILYTASNILINAYGAYDSSGNLYIDGTSSKHGMAIAVLDKGSSNFVAVAVGGLGNRNHRASGVQWDGQYIDIGDSLAGSIYRMSVSGSTGTIVQTIKARGWFHHYPIEFAIYGKRLFDPLGDKLLFILWPQGRKKLGGFLGDIGSQITVTP